MAETTVEYDFAYEFQQYAESLQKPLKTFRVDTGKASTPTGDGVLPLQDDNQFSTMHDTIKYTTTTKTTKKSTQYAYDKTITTNDKNVVQDNTAKQSQVQFHEIRNAKTPHPIYNNQLLDSAGIRDPVTGNSLTVAEAIQIRLLDVRTGEFMINGKPVSVRDAVQLGLIDESLAHQLLQLITSTDPSGSELALLETLKRQLHDSETSHDSSEKKIKVTVEDIIENESPKNIAEAISAGNVDTKTGLYHVKSGKTISLAEAYERGYLIRHESVTIKSNPLCLSDAIAHGLVDTAGWIADRNSGDKFRLDSAVSNQLIDPNIREVVDAKHDVKVTLNEALQSGILNPKTGRYINDVTKEKLTFIEAKNRQLIVKPYTLKDICDLSLLDKNAKITSPMRREKLSIMQAIESGVLDGGQLKCVTKTKGELVTLQEAIAEGIVLLSESKYRDFMTGETIAIPEAVERGLISSVSQKSIFDIDGFKDMRSNDFVSFNTAVSRDILRKKNNGFFLETGRDNSVPLEIAVREGLARKEVYDMFNKGIGVRNASGQELTVFDLCYHNLIDPKTGYLLDPKTGEIVPLDSAIERKFITRDGALLLSSLLNITLTTETVTRTINRYVTIRGSSMEPEHDGPPTFLEALRQGYIDEARQLFKDPTTGNVYSVQQALSYGLLAPDNNESVPEPTTRKKTKSTITIVTKQIIPESEPIQLNTQKYVEKSVEIPITQEVIRCPNVSSEVPTQFRETSSPEPIQIAPGAIYDPSTALVIFTQSGKTENIITAAVKGQVDENLITFKDPDTHDILTLTDAITRKVYDSETECIFTKDGSPIDLITASKLGIFIVHGTPLVAAEGALRTIRFVTDPRTGEQIPVEVAYERGIVSKEQLRKTISEETPEERVIVLQKMRKLILKPNDALSKGIIDREAFDILQDKNNFAYNNEILSISEALSRDIIDGSKGKIIDPQHNRVMNIREAVDRHILDPEETNHILIPLAKNLSIPKLFEQGLIDTETQKILHPESGYPVSIHEAIVCEILDPLSKLCKPLKCTVEEAIDNQIIDDHNSSFKLNGRSLNISQALDAKVFENDYETKSTSVYIPPIGMTFPVAVERNLVYPKEKSIVHPQTKAQIPIKQAIQDHFLMSIPYSPKADAIDVETAIDNGLLDVVAQTMIHPTTGEKATLRQALETGALVVQPISEFVVTQKPLPRTEIIETITAVHTVTTKTIELVQGYILISNNEVKNINTGEICSIEEAKALGILREESASKEVHSSDMDLGKTDHKMKAVKIPDQENQQSVVTTVSTDSRKPTIDMSKMKSAANTVTEAAKMGAIGVIAVPVLAGSAVISGFKNLVSATKPSKDGKETIQHQSTSKTTIPSNEDKFLTSLPTKTVAIDDFILNERKTNEGESGVVTSLSKNDAVMVSNNDNITKKIDTTSVLTAETASTDINIENASVLGPQQISETVDLDHRSIVSTGLKEPITEAISLFSHDSTTPSKPEITREHIPQNNVDDKIQDFLNSERYQSLSTVGNENNLKAALSVTGPNAIDKSSVDTRNEIPSTMDTTDRSKPSLNDTQSNNFGVDQPTGVDIDLFSHNIKERQPIQVNTVDRITADGTLQALNQHESRQDDQLSPLDENRITEENLVALQQPSYVIDVNDELSMENLYELNLYDVENHWFTDPTTGQKISFQTLVLDLNIFNPETIKVKNISTGEFETLTQALERPLLDKHTGHMVHRRTGEKIPFFECIARGWIIRTDPKLERSAAIEHIIDPTTGKVVLDDGRVCSIVDAINKGLLDTHAISVRDPVSGEVIPLRMAIELGVVNMETGTVIDIQTLKEIPMEDAFRFGFLVPGARKPISLEAAVRKGLYDPNTGKLYDSESQNQVDVQKSIEIGLVDPKISLIVDTITNQELKLDCAIEDELVIAETGQIKDNKRNQLVPFHIGVEKNLLRTNNVTWSLPEVLQREYYIPKSGKVLNPVTGEEILLQEAIEMNFIELDSCLVKDDHKNSIVPAKLAAKEGLLDTVKGALNHPNIPLDEAFEKGYLISTKKPLSLVDCILRGLYDPTTSKFSIDDKRVDLKNAIALKLINTEELVLLDPKTDSVISISEAIAKGYLDPIGGYVINPFTSTKLSLPEALENRILIPPKRKRSLPDAVYRGLYDPKTGQFSNTITREKLSTEHAIRRGVLDPDSTIVKVSGQVVPFKVAAQDGIVDSERGTVLDDYENAINFKEAFDRGILTEVKKPIRLMEAVVKNVYDESDGRFVDPKTGLKLSFAQAVDESLLENESVQIKDFKSGLYKNLSLAYAKESGVIDGDSAKLTYNNQKVTIKHAFDVGILMDTLAPISVQRAVHQGLLDEKTGKIADPKTGRQISLLEAMRSFVIHPHLPCYFDEQNEKMYSLSETCRNGIINRREGVFKEIGSNTFVSLSEALNLGLIIDIENAGFGLYELLAMGFYDTDSRKVIHPVSGRKMNLNEACAEDVVSLSSSIVKSSENNKYVRLQYAIEEGIIDDINGVYNLGEVQLNLEEARCRGLIVSNRRLLSLEMAIRMKLFRPDTGKFCDPTTGEFNNLIEAINSGFIDPNTTVFKNHVNGVEKPLIQAVEDGDIEVSKGRVLDPKSQSSYNYDVGFSRGILLTILKPLTERSHVVKREESHELLGQTPISMIVSKPREMSLEEAIKYNIIDPKTALVRDFVSFKFVPFEKANNENTIDLSKRTLVDPKALYFAFDSTLVVYVREPITFEQAAELKILDLQTGMVTWNKGADDRENSNDDSANEHSDAQDAPKIYTLKDAVTIGIVDPDSALVKDMAKGKLTRLQEAFRKGLMDANKANVLNTKSSKLCSLQQAYEDGLLVTPKRSFGLIETITFNLYNPTNGLLVDPFQMNPDIINRKKFSLNEAISKGLVDPSTTVVREPSTGVIMSLTAAINNGIIDDYNGRLVDKTDEKNTIDFVKAMEKGLILPAEQRQAVFEKFNLCEENVTELLKWITSVEHKISAVGGPKEKIDELRNQINALKQIKEEIETQQRPVATCLEQIRQIVLTGSDVLSAPEVNTLENAGRELRSRVDRANDRTGRLLRRLETGRDELTKLKNELDVFSEWLQVARRSLEEKERSLSDLSRLSTQSESIRDFVSDVISHQADLRFITMAAQKFVDESKEFLIVLNDFRTTLPERLPHVEPLSSAESPIRQEVSLVSAQYKDLLHRVNALQDRMSGLGGRQREYQDALDKANEWIRSIQPQVSRIVSEPIACDPKALQTQMNDAKSMHNELLTNGRLIDNTQHALDNLLRTLGSQLSPVEINQLEIPVIELKNKHHDLLHSLSEYCKSLDKTLVQSQGVQDALDGMAGWVNQAEEKLKLQMRPASLIKERLQEQIREHKSLQADISSHQASIDSVQSSAKHLMNTASNARIAKKIESNLNDVTSKFERLQEKVLKRGEFLDDVYSRLSKCLHDIANVEQELCCIQDGIENRETSQLQAEDLARRMIDVARQKEHISPQFDECIRNGKELISMRDVTDTNPLRDRLKALEAQWRNIGLTLDEKVKLSKQKAEQQVAYETLKEEVLAWLINFEGRVNNLDAVAVDLDRIRQQTDDLKPICREYRDYNSTIEKVNDLGAQYDALVRPESPGRKRSTFSPVKRVSPLRRMSGDGRSPSPTKGGVLSPLSTGSSGFGSRRSSQDGFQLSELSPVQQQLSEINNRYGLIGVRLNDRQNELDNMIEEVRKYNENLKNLASFLDRVQRLVPKETVGNKDEADRCIKQARKVLEDMYEKQSLLDTTKVQIKDILRRKPDVLGAEKLRIECDTIVDKWKTMSDVCKGRIEFSEKLRDFLDMHSNLKNWLESKERMLTVLGPISSDPRMVQSQVQQVQVLREEFRTQQPQLKHFQEIGQDVLTHVGDSTDGHVIEKKLKDIIIKWEELVGRLDDRANSLGGAADSSKEFDAAVNRLREALQNISDNLDALPLDGDHQENLRKVENLERQLEGQRPLLADAEQSAEALCKILGDPASRADVNSRVAALEKQYQALQKKLDTKKAETEASLRDGRHFAENCTKTLGWLSSELSNLSERLLVSAHRPTLQHQIDTHEPIYREVMAREHEVIMLINKGKDLSDRQQDRSVKRDLERIQVQWEKLRREAVDRHTRLQTCMEHCKKFAQTSEAFLAWLRTAEDKLVELSPGVLSKSKLEGRLRELQAFRSEIWKHSGEFENTKSLGESFLSTCDVDKDPIKTELQDISERWERLNNDLIARAQEIENCSRRLGDFNDELRNLDHAVGRCEDRLAAHDALGGAAKDPKLLDRVKAIRDELTQLSRPLQSLKAMAHDISAEARAAGGDAEHITNEVDGVSDRMDDLQGRLSDRCGELQSAATAVAQFNEQMKSLGIDLNALEHDVEHLSPPGREIKVVQTQLDDLNVLQKKLDGVARRMQEAEHAADNLIDAGFSTDISQTRDQIANLRKTLVRLDNRVRDHEENLQSSLSALREFYDMHSQTLDDIQNIVDEFKRMKPVGSELEQIRRQQKDFQTFRDKAVESLSPNVDKVNLSGRDLVRSAASGVSTSAIEKELEKLNDRWNDLKERINERDRRLDVALLQSGKFKEALAGLAKWLSDTEEMVANQKPPSSDYKVVKAQLQEQKFLKKMLLDRQNSMSSLATLGKEVANHCEPGERTSIEKQLNDLMKRFDALTNGAEQRAEDLEEAMQVAKRFHDKISPLEMWLDNTERMVKSMELVPTDEEKIQQRIREHDRLHDDILSKKPDFTDLADIASQLMHLVSDDEAVHLGEKVRTITERYTNLVDSSDNIGDLLTESRQGLRHLVLTYQELVAWMDSMENELKRFKFLPVHSEKLLEQMDHLLELNENIANHAPNVEATVDSGAELMKHISNDEAIQLKDKLDSLQRRYGDLATRGGDLLKTAQNALPLVQQFHDSHNRLVEWMQVAESALQSSEPRQSDILRLETELADMRPILDTINLVGPQLCQLSPGDGASTIEGIVTRDNRRFDAIVEQIQRKAERLHLSNQRAKEVTGDLDELLEWFREMDTTLREADAPAIEPKLVRAQLQEHRSINDDISSQKGRVRDVTATSKKVLRESQHNENTTTLREKLEDLKEIVDTVIQLCSERLGILEQALPLSEHFADSHNGLSVWLDDMEQQIARLSMPALRPDQITVQQDKNERLLQSIAEHKPLLDKLNKTGEALGSLVAEDDSAKINEILESDNARYAALRLELRERQQALENALQESSQFSDKLEGMLRALANTVDQVNQLEPLSALPQKIREQMEDNVAIIDDLDKRSDAFSAVQRAANDVIAKAANKSDPAVRDIKSKLEKLNHLWNDVQMATKKRGSSLDDILSVAEPFWKQLQGVMKTLKDLEETLSSQEPPAAQPQDIQKQQVALQEIRQEIDQTKPDVEQVRRHGSNLMSLCGEPDKPEVKKHIEDLDHAWDNITALYAKREENLIDAMEKAMEFHETLQNLLKFLTKAEGKFSQLGPVGSDIDAVKRQIEQLKSFKDEVDPHMVEIEALNRQAVELTERTSPEQAASIREPLVVVNRRWEALLRSMVERQKQLEHALLHLGQLQHALNELLVWISRTDSTLDQLKPIPGDPQLLEVELAKLKVLANDIQAHQNSVDTLNDAGRQLIESEKTSVEASTTQEKLRKLNDEWKRLLQKASDRQHELEEALREAQGFIAEVQDILGWLGDVDTVIGASKPVGGLPETATEQLERFMEVYNELEENRPKVETIQTRGQEYIKRQNQMKVSSSNLTHTLRTLKQRWDAVVSRASDKKIKLEIALKEATEFHETLQAFVEWLNQAEKQLANASAVSRVLETIQSQMEEHKVLQKDVSMHREAMLLLDKKGTHLKYFSQKQDVILIKNVLVSVQHRWERVVSKAAERTRALDHGYKEAREFNDAWASINQYLIETEAGLDHIIEEATSLNEPQKIKKCITKLKETHRQLAGKQMLYDTTMRTGKNLIERSPKGDEHVLNRMLSELKENWARVWSKSIERQRKLEEALLLSGQFSDALGELLEWLKKAKNRLNENGPVHGDLETVQALCEHHKHIEQDLQKRSSQMQGVLKTGRELEKSGNNPEVGAHLDELQTIWDEVKRISAKRGERLQMALKDAEKLNGSVQALFDWLDHAEHKLRYTKNAPDDEKVSREMMDIHQEFMTELRKREVQKTETFTFAEEIINIAYPDAIPIIKNWLTIIQQRWDEISQWAINRESKLHQHLQSLKDLDDTIEELLAWLNGLESTLLNLEQEPLPDSIPPLEKLIEDHKEFMENTARRQTEVDRACKPRQLPPGARKHSRTGKTPVRGSSHDLREQSPDGTLRRQSFKGSRDQGLNTRKTSRVTPSRDTPDRDRLPHYGPRFSPSSTAPELEFRSTRAKLLWDKWRHVWMLSWERQRRLHEHLIYLKDVERVRNFSWDDWRKRFLKYMNHKKSRLTDLFRKMDKDNNGLIPRSEFIDGILNTKFDTSRMEMGAVADLFDRNGEGLIDWQEFIAALRPDWQERKPANDSDKIHDEVKRLVMLCTCRQKFRVFQVGEGKYRFGDSQKLRLVRILRSTVMVRVGGGWVALDEFLQKNDPCRAKGRTNIELREQFILADGVSQSMAAFTPRRATPTSTSSAQNGNTPQYMSGQGPIVKVRERSVRSIPMSRPSRSSLSASTPDSLSDNEGSHGNASGRYTPRKVTYTGTRTGLTPGGSRTGSKPNSRPLSRQGSKAPSRHGSNLSLDSTGEATPSRIPQRKPTTGGAAISGPALRPTRLSSTTATPSTSTTVRPNGIGSTTTRKTASGSASPAPTRNGGMSRSSSIPALTGYGSKYRRNISGSSTPSGMQTPRKTSADPTFSSNMRRTSRSTTPIEKREPFRL